MESEIFGHERGAFTGAAERRIGCFELADAARCCWMNRRDAAPTQAKLLRVLEDRKVRRLGSKSETPVDVRVLARPTKSRSKPSVAASCGRNLYFRLNVFHIHLPPLREHKDDIALLVEHILRDVNAKMASMCGDWRGSSGHFYGAHLAGKYSRTPQRAGARCDYVRERSDHAGVPAGRVRKDGSERAERSLAIKFPWARRGCDGTRADPADTGRNGNNKTRRGNCSASA